MMRYRTIGSGVSLALALSAVTGVGAQQRAGATSTAPARDAAAASAVAPALPAGYTIGAQDVLSIVFWRDKDMSGSSLTAPTTAVRIPGA